MMPIILYFLSAFVRIVLITAFVVAVYLLIDTIHKTIMRKDYGRDKDL